MIRFSDFAVMHAEIQPELVAAAERVIKSNWFILGQEVEAFEREFAAYCGARFCVGVGNGLDALHLIFRALQIGPGDEVIVPAQTFIASWLAVSYAGATPAPVDIDAQTYNLDPELVTRRITRRTRAILAVHLYGLPCEMAALEKIADEYGLLLIEDAAQAQGASYRGRKTGSLGVAAGFSFYPVKNLGALGDAGAVVTSDENLYEALLWYRNYGSPRKYHHVLKGFNTRLDELQAAFLRVKLKFLNSWNRERQRLAQLYFDLLDPVRFQLPAVPNDTEHVFHQFVIQPRDHSREYYMEKLKKHDIQTMIHYPIPPHLTEAYADLGYTRGAFPVAEKAAENCFSLPIYPGMKDEQIQQIVEVLNA